MKQHFQFNMNCMKTSAEGIKSHEIQSKNEIMMNFGVSIKNQMIGVPVKKIICEILVHVIVSVIGHGKLTEIRILKIVSAKNF